MPSNARRNVQLSAALVSCVAVALANGQDYRYQTYGGGGGGGNGFPPAHHSSSSSTFDRDAAQPSNNPYNTQPNNQYGQQNSYQNRPLYNQPGGRPGSPAYRPNGYNSDYYPVSVRGVARARPRNLPFSGASNQTISVLKAPRYATFLFFLCVLLPSTFS